MKQTKDYIEELLQRFFDGQTTENEEQLLADYFRNAESIPEEWQVYKEIFNSFKTDAYDFCQEELDAILVLADKKSKAVCLLPWASVACVVAIVGLLVWHPWVENPISEAPSVAQVKTKETTKDSADINVEEKLLVVEERVHEQTLAKQDNSSLLAEAKLSMRKRNEKKEALPRQKNENKLPRSTKETKQTVQPANSKEITTSELLETINLLVDVGNENITITSLPDNEGFAVKTISYGGESNSYLLKRCTENSSLELKSQVINF